MIALDTNVLARAIAEEVDADPATLRQQREARALLSSGRPLFVPVTVIMELEWVLRGVYGMPVAEIASVFEDLLSVESLTVDRSGAVAHALHHDAAGLDFADALHLAQAGTCSGLVTFDKRFARGARKQGLTPAVQASFP